MAGDKETMVINKITTFFILIFTFNILCAPTSSKAQCKDTKNFPNNVKNRHYYNKKGNCTL